MVRCFLGWAILSVWLTFEEPAQAQDVKVISALSEAVAKGDKAALAKLASSAKQGNAIAQNALGVLYDSGKGVPKDAFQALEWYRKAADQGDVFAQLNLADNYSLGEGAPKDKAQAVYWYRKAADQGWAPAQMKLGLAYGNGEGVPKNFVAAYMWYNIAAAQGDDRAKNLRALIEGEMTREQIGEAQRLSSEWKPKKSAVSTLRRLEDSRNVY